jgi:osmotically-inducible protein OsmY
MVTDQQITETVIQALLWDARVSPSRLNVETKQGIVTLSGIVDTFHKKWSALDTTIKVREVVEIVDNIVVKPADSVDDAVLQQNIANALKEDSRLPPDGIRCSVRNGTVMLHGEVENYFQKLAAEEQCRWVKGVVKVENGIEVVPAGTDKDKQIKRKVKELLHQNLRSGTNRIDVNVEHGIVTLSGKAGKIGIKVYAETLASLVANVSYIRNEIIISRENQS